MRAGEDFDDSRFALKTAPISTKEKLAFYNDADYCFVTESKMWPILRIELDSLIREGGVYYSVINRLNDPEHVLVVLFFDDSLIDLMAEI